MSERKNEHARRLSTSSKESQAAALAIAQQSNSDTAFEIWSKSQTHVDPAVLRQFKEQMERNSVQVNNYMDFLSLEDLKSGKSYDKSSSAANTNGQHDTSESEEKKKNWTSKKFNTITRNLTLKKMQFRRSVTASTVASKMIETVDDDDDDGEGSISKEEIKALAAATTGRQGSRSRSIGANNLSGLFTPPASADLASSNESFSAGDTDSIRSSGSVSSGLGVPITTAAAAAAAATAPSPSTRRREMGSSKADGGHASSGSPPISHHGSETNLNRNISGSMVSLDESSRNVRQLSVDGMEYFLQKGDGRIIITGGLLEKLVAKIADKDTLDTEYFNIFLLTFRHVISPKELMEMLLQRFDFVDPDQKGDATYGVVQLRTCNFILKWMDRCWFDFHHVETLLTLVEQLIQKMHARKCDQLAARVRQTMERKFEETEQELNEAILKLAQAPQIEVAFEDISEKDLCEQLTLLDLKFFRAIKSEEFMVQLWCSDNEPNAWFAKRNLTLYVEWFNKISTWVSTEICLASENKRRAAIIEKFIKVAKMCKKYHNFATLYAILSGLNHGAVCRMKKSWEIVSHRSVATLRELELVMDPAHNFDSYRKILRSKSNMPLLPILGLFLKDLTFLNEMPKRMNNNPQFINFFKLRSIFEAVTEFCHFQASEYPSFKPDTKIQNFCLAVQSASDRVLYQYSYLCEPRSNVLQEKLKLIENLELSNFGRNSPASSLIPQLEARRMSTISNASVTASIHTIQGFSGTSGGIGSTSNGGSSTALFRERSTSMASIDSALSEGQTTPGHQTHQPLSSQSSFGALRPQDSYSSVNSAYSAQSTPILSNEFQDKISRASFCASVNSSSHGITDDSATSSGAHSRQSSNSEHASVNANSGIQHHTNLSNPINPNTANSSTSSSSAPVVTFVLGSNSNLATPVSPSNSSAPSTPLPKGLTVIQIDGDEEPYRFRRESSMKPSSPPVSPDKSSDSMNRNKNADGSDDDKNEEAKDEDGEEDEQVEVEEEKERNTRSLNDSNIAGMSPIVDVNETPLDQSLVFSPANAYTNSQVDNHAETVI